jgi:hypothetical protein
MYLGCQNIIFEIVSRCESGCVVVAQPIGALLITVPSMALGTS